MSVRIFYIEALRRVQQSEATRRAFFDAINAGNIEVRCQRVAQFQILVEDLHLDDYETEDVIYIHPDLIDHEAGKIRIRDIAELDNGFHRWPHPPYWHAHKRDRAFTIYMSAREGTSETEPTIIDIDYLRQAYFLPDWSAVVDNLDTLVRRQAFGLTIDHRAFMRCFPAEGNIGDEAVSRKGRPAIYNCEECDDAFLKWHRTNLMVSIEQKIQKLRDVYHEKGLRVGKDQIAKIEKRKIRDLTS